MPRPDLAHESHDLAAEIANGAAAHATVVGSGRVGRIKTLSVDERAELAYIRHHHTGYRKRLNNANVGLDRSLDGGGGYREIKRAAHDEDEALLDAHRHRRSGGGTTV